jgi:uncharacterized membrane protein
LAKKKKKQPFINKLRLQMTTGIVTVVPLALTIYLFWWIFQALDSILGQIFTHFLGFRIYGVGLLAMILLIWIAGIMASGFVGSRLIKIQQKVFSSIPLLGSVYKALHQLSTSFIGDKASGGFSQPVLTDAMETGVYSIGFITNSKEILIGEKSFVHVFIPTVPNPTTGFLFLVEKDRVIALDIPTDEAFKMVVSLGMVTPEKYNIQAEAVRNAAKNRSVPQGRRASDRKKN